MSPIRAVTVYCSSSSRVDRQYLRAAAELGCQIATSGWQLVFGGNCVGSMAALADGARQAGGQVIGITPQLLVDKGIADRACSELIVTADLRQRKQIMEQRGDAFVALPGGLGTLEEIFEIIVGRTLGCHHKPIVILNVAGYYDPLLRMLDHGMQQHFIGPKARQHWQVCSDVSSSIAYLRNWHADKAPALPLEAASG